MATINGEFYPESIDRLMITDSNLTTLPESIGNLKKLETVIIVRDNLTSIPYNIKYLTNLRILILNYNNIIRLPDTIGSLTNLQTLSIDNNNLIRLPESIGNLSNLKIIKLRYNRLTSLPDTIGNLQNLEELDISHNNLIDLPFTIENLINLKYLDISHNQLTTINKMPRLKKIDSFKVNPNPFTNIKLINKSDWEIQNIIIILPDILTLNKFIGTNINNLTYHPPYTIYMSQNFVKQTQYKSLPLYNYDLRIILSQKIKPHIVYSCPDGHLHTADGCGVPIDVYTCGINDCQLIVGGKHHMIVPGNYVVYHDGYEYSDIRYGEFPIGSYDIYKKIRTQANKARRDIGEPELPLLPPIEPNIARKVEPDDIVTQDVNVECLICGDSINEYDANAYLLPSCGHLMHKECVEVARGGNLAWIDSMDGIPIPEQDLLARKCPVCNINFKFGKSVKRKSVRRKSVRRKSVRRKSVRRKSIKRKSVKRKSVKRKSVKRKSVKRKSVKRKSVKSVKRKSVRRTSVRRKKSVRKTSKRKTSTR